MKKFVNMVKSLMKKHQKFVMVFVKVVRFMIEVIGLLAAIKTLMG